jgi:hypothetical protein
MADRFRRRPSEHPSHASCERKQGESGAEHHDASLFVLDYDVDQPVTDVLSPTQVRASLASGSKETKDGTLI